MKRILCPKLLTFDYIKNIQIRFDPFINTYVFLLSRMIYYVQIISYRKATLVEIDTRLGLLIKNRRSSENRI